jgi:hypothetical protein
VLSGLRPLADGWGHAYLKIHYPPPGDSDSALGEQQFTLGC